MRFLGRREFITVLGATAVTARAQRAERMRRVGVLNTFPENDSVNRSTLTPFVGALVRLGWVEGENIRLDYRFAAGDPMLSKTYAAELVGSSPDAILGTTTPAPRLGQRCPVADLAIARRCVIRRCMTGNELLRRLRRLGSQRGVAARFDEERGKGSHGTLYFGDRFTVLKDRRAEIRPGLLHAMLRQLGLSERDLR